LRVSKQLYNADNEISEISIVQVLKEINQTIGMLSDQISDLFDYRQVPPTPISQKGAVFSPQLAQLLGNKLCTVFEDAYHARDPVWVHIGLNALLLCLAAEAFNEGWCNPEVIGISNELRMTGLCFILDRH
jgi:hypothetical protein